jgi:hypothetical protein
VFGILHVGLSVCGHGVGDLVDTGLVGSRSWLLNDVGGGLWSRSWLLNDVGDGLEDPELRRGLIENVGSGNICR